MLLLIPLTGLSARDRQTPSITVAGSGIVEVSPDTAFLRVGISETAETTREAMAQTEEGIRSILEAASALGISEDRIRTGRLNIFPEYRWKEGESILIGQKASQTLEIELNQLKTRPELLSGLLEKLGGINGIEISDLRFDTSDKEPWFEKARERAFQNALQKAQQLADLSGRTLRAPLSITENSRSGLPPAPMMMRAADSNGMPVPPSDVTITVDLTIVFEMK